MGQERLHNSFPCQLLPEEPAAAKLLGIYPQRQPDLWMQRVRTPGGRLTAAQWWKLVEIIRNFTPTEPLHLTTRQDLEIHGLTPAAVPQVHSALAETGLTGWGTGGDTIRNVTVCPCSGVVPGAPDLLPLAQRITELLQSQQGAFALPRKLKISLSACREGCAQPWINDLGFVTVRHHEGWKFQAVLAGSLGAKPATGIVYGRLLEANEVLPLTLAAFHVFAAHGDREHRHTARLRHVRQRLGDATFLELLVCEFTAVLREQAWPVISLAGPESGFAFKRLLRFEDGNLAAWAAEGLAELVRCEDIRVRIDNHHGIAVFARDELALGAALAETRLDRFTKPGPHVVACPGTRWCAHGLADTGRLAKAVRDQLAGAAAGDVLIAISGCPNGCAHSAVADVGAVGAVTAMQGQRREAWNLLAGGERGRGARLGQSVASRVSLDEAVVKIAELATQAAASAPAGRE